MMTHIDGKSVKALSPLRGNDPFSAKQILRGWLLTKIYLVAIYKYQVILRWFLVYLNISGLAGRDG